MIMADSWHSRTTKPSTAEERPAHPISSRCFASPRFRDLRHTPSIRAVLSRGQASSKHQNNAMSITIHDCAKKAGQRCRSYAWWISLVDAGQKPRERERHARPSRCNTVNARHRQSRLTPLPRVPGRVLGCLGTHQSERRSHMNERMIVRIGDVFQTTWW